MTTHRLVLFALLISGISIGLAQKAQAQFPGDFYFNPASQLGTPDAPTTLTVEFFAGTSVYGAALFDVSFDRSRARIDAVRAGVPSSELQRVQHLDTPDGVSVAVFNQGSLTGPIGTILMLEVDVVPLVPAGERVEFSIAPREALTASGTPFPSSAGFSGEIVVVDSGTTTSITSKPIDASPVEQVLGAWSPVRDGTPAQRPGHVFVAWDAQEAGEAVVGVKRRVVTVDPTAPTD